jgi:inner membrane protein
MPSPIAHLGAGYAIYRFYKHRLPQDHKRFWKFPLQLVMVVGLSMIPDLDVIPAIIFRDMKAYHNNFSHSLLLAIPVAFLIAGIFHRIYPSNFWLWFAISLVSYDLHVIMDALTAERGVMMLWPLSQNRFVSPIRIFYGLHWGLGWFSLWHLWTVFTESVFVLVLMAVVKYFDQRKNRINTVFPQES